MALQVREDEATEACGGGSFGYSWPLPRNLPRNVCPASGVPSCSAEYASRTPDGIKTRSHFSTQLLSRGLCCKEEFPPERNWQTANALLHPIEYKISSVNWNAS